MCEACHDPSHQPASGDLSAPSAAGLASADFVHLHNHTHYSLLDGLTKVPELVDYVKNAGMQAVAVTDHGTMSGLVDLYKTAADAKIKPILGLEAYVAARKMTDKDPAHDKVRYHITLLAKNNQGYENLCRLMTEAELYGTYYRPRIDHEIMEKYSEGIICLSGCSSSEISAALRGGDLDRARKLVDWYSQTYKDNFYLEMQDHGHPDSPTHWSEQDKINRGLQQIAKETGLPLVVTCDGHYLCRADQDAHEVLLCIGTGSNLSDTNRMSLKDFQLHVIPPEDIIARWGKDFPEAILNTRKIAESCNVDLQLGRILIPKFPVPDGEDEKSYLDKLVFRGLAYRYAGKALEEVDNYTVEQCRALLDDKVLERIDYELSVVNKMGYNGYFLIVQDFISWGKSQRIVFGPGRGSAAGSILAYALRITELDPLRYDLLFERFLNPDRISMPDIDTDIQDTRRDEVIEYCANKYGDARVSNICTFGKMMAKQAVRDVARVLNVPYAEADRIAKLVPDPIMGRHVRLKDAINDNSDIKHEYNTNPVAREVFNYAARLDGTIRNHGVHACGVVIAPDDLVKFLPLEVARKKTASGHDVIATQFPMNQVEELGLLKMDFLGLSNLTVINNALRIIRKVYHNDIDISHLPLDDEKTYQLFQRAETTGVFQLESAGMKRYLKDLQASSFEDIIAMVALYRPGPMQFIDSFIKRKHGEEKITYLHPGLENALKSTYGILIYQEQFMQISKEWCGFTGGQADTLRKAVGKKKIDLMEKVKPEFIEGAVKVGGATAEIAETFWGQLLEFANYCFNKSHAACYALIAYWTAYLKAHYPDAFMAALMTSDMQNTDRLAIEIAECKNIGIKVLGPDINQSYADFAIVGGENTIRFGLAGIKNMGKSLVEEIVIPERDKNGPFRSAFDFAKRISSNKFNKKSWEAAIKTGAFDQFGSRSDLLFNLETIQDYGQKVQKDSSAGQMSFFSAFGAAGEIPEPDFVPAPKQYTEKEQLLWEKELMGRFISSHPLDKYDSYFQEKTHPFSFISKEYDDYNIVIGGIVGESRVIATKSGKKMAFVKLSNKFGECELVVFPELYQQSISILAPDTIIKVGGRVSAKDRDGNLTSDAKIIPDTIQEISEVTLETYQPSGLPMHDPVKQPARRRGRASAGGATSSSRPVSASSAAPAASAPAPVVQVATTSPSSAPAPTISQPAVSTSVVSQPAASVPTAPRSGISAPRLFVLVENPSDAGTLAQIKQLVDRHPGSSEFILVLKDGNNKHPMSMPFRINPSETLISDLQSLLGAPAVKLQ